MTTRSATSSASGPSPEPSTTPTRGTSPPARAPITSAAAERTGLRYWEVLGEPRSAGEQGVHLADGLPESLVRAHGQELVHLLPRLEGGAQLHPRAAVVLGEPQLHRADRHVG